MYGWMDGERWGSKWEAATISGQVWWGVSWGEVRRLDCIPGCRRLKQLLKFSNSGPILTSFFKSFIHFYFHMQLHKWLTTAL